jgi:hypothetical protein
MAGRIDERVSPEKRTASALSRIRGISRTTGGGKRARRDLNPRPSDP